MLQNDKIKQNQQNHKINLYGRETVQHKLKNGLKTQTMHFLPVFELMSDSLMTI